MHEREKERERKTSIVDERECERVRERERENEGKGKREREKYIFITEARLFQSDRRKMWLIVMKARSLVFLSSMDAREKEENAPCLKMRHRRGSKNVFRRAMLNPGPHYVSATPRGRTLKSFLVVRFFHALNF